MNWLKEIKNTYVRVVITLISKGISGIENCGGGTHNILLKNFGGGINGQN